MSSSANEILLAKASDDNGVLTIADFVGGTVHFPTTYDPWGDAWALYTKEANIPADGSFCSSLGSVIRDVSISCSGISGKALEATSNYNAERTWLFNEYVLQLYGDGRLFQAGQKCGCDGKPAHARPARKISLWNYFMSAHQTLYRDLQRSGFRVIQDRYSNLTESEKADWKGRQSRGDSLTVLEQEEWWLCYDSLPNTTRKKIKRSKRKLPPPAVAKESAQSQLEQAAQLSTQDSRKIARADSKFRSRVEKMTTAGLTKVLAKKTDAEIARIFESMNMAGSNGQRSWRRNDLLAYFIRLRHHERNYDYWCRSCRRIRVKRKCTCSAWIDGTNAAKQGSLCHPASAVALLAPPSNVVNCEEASGVDWGSDEAITSAFLRYLTGPNQEICNERKLAAHTKRLISYLEWHRTNALGNDAPFSRRLVMMQCVSAYMSTLGTSAAKESFTVFQMLIAKFVGSMDPTRFIESADDLMKAQSRKRVKRQASARKKKTTLTAEKFLSKKACEELRLTVATGLAADLKSVSERLRTDQITTNDKRFMAFVVPAVICVLGRPLRACDFASLTTNHGIAIASGKSLAIEEKKESCKHAFVYVPANAHIQRCLSIYNDSFRGFLSNGGAKTPKTAATKADIDHVAGVLKRLSPHDMLRSNATSKNKSTAGRLPSKFKWILENEKPTPGGWSSPSLTACDLRIGFNASDHNECLLLDARGNVNSDVGRSIRQAFERYVQEPLTLTAFRKILETVAARDDNTSSVVHTQSLMNFGCDHTKAVAARHYIIADKIETLRVGALFSKSYELSSVPGGLFGTTPVLSDNTALAMPVQALPNGNAL